MGGKPRAKPPPTDTIGRIGLYSQVGRAIRNVFGGRESQREHLAAWAALVEATTGPSGTSAYPKERYRKATVLTVPRDMAVQKDRLDAANLRRLRAGGVSDGLEGDVRRTMEARNQAILRRLRQGKDIDDLARITPSLVETAAHYEAFGPKHPASEFAAFLDGVSEDELHKMVDDSLTPGPSGHSPPGGGAPGGTSPAPSRAMKPTRPPASKTLSRVLPNVRDGGAAAARSAFRGALTLVPGPLDAGELIVDLLGAPGVAREALRGSAHARGIRIGAAAALLKLPPSVIRSDLAAHGRQRDVATRVIQAEGVRETSYNNGVVEGYRYVRNLPASVRNRIELDGWARIQTMPAAIDQGRHLSGAARRALTERSWSEIRQDPRAHGLTPGDVQAVASMLSIGTAETIEKLRQADAQKAKREALAARMAELEHLVNPASNGWW